MQYVKGSNNTAEISRLLSSDDTKENREEIVKLMSQATVLDFRAVTGCVFDSQTLERMIHGLKGNKTVCHLTFHYQCSAEEGKPDRAFEQNEYWNKQLGALLECNKNIVYIGFSGDLQLPNKALADTIKLHPFLATMDYLQSNDCRPELYLAASRALMNRTLSDLEMTLRPGIDETKRSELIGIGNEFASFISDIDKLLQKHTDTANDTYKALSAETNGDSEVLTSWVKGALSALVVVGDKNIVQHLLARRAYKLLGEFFKKKPEVATFLFRRKKLANELYEKFIGYFPEANQRDFFAEAHKKIQAKPKGATMDAGFDLDTFKKDFAKPFSEAVHFSGEVEGLKDSIKGSIKDFYEAIRANAGEQSKKNRHVNLYPLKISMLFLMSKREGLIELQTLINDFYLSQMGGDSENIPEIIRATVKNIKPYISDEFVAGRFVLSLSDANDRANIIAVSAQLIPQVEVQMEGFLQYLETFLKASDPASEDSPVLRAMPENCVKLQPEISRNIGQLKSAIASSFESLVAGQKVADALKAPRINLADVSVLMQLAPSLSHTNADSVLLASIQHGTLLGIVKALGNCSLPFAEAAKQLDKAMILCRGDDEERISLPEASPPNITLVLQCLRGDKFDTMVKETSGAYRDFTAQLDDLSIALFASALKKQATSKSANLDLLPPETRDKINLDLGLPNLILRCKEAAEFFDQKRNEMLSGLRAMLRESYFSAAQTFYDYLQERKTRFRYPGNFDQDVTKNARLDWKLAYQRYLKARNTAAVFQADLGQTTLAAKRFLQIQGLAQNQIARLIFYRSLYYVVRRHDEQYEGDFSLTAKPDYIKKLSACLSLGVLNSYLRYFDLPINVLVQQYCREKVSDFSKKNPALFDTTTLLDIFGDIMEKGSFPKKDFSKEKLFQDFVHAMADWLAKAWQISENKRIVQKSENNTMLEELNTLVQSARACVHFALEKQLDTVAIFSILEDLVKPHIKEMPRETFVKETYEGVLRRGEEVAEFLNWGKEEIFSGLDQYLPWIEKRLQFHIFHQPSTDYSSADDRDIHYLQILNAYGVNFSHNEDLIKETPTPISQLISPSVLVIEQAQQVGETGSEVSSETDPYRDDASQPEGGNAKESSVLEDVSFSKMLGFFSDAPNMLGLEARKASGTRPFTGFSEASSVNSAPSLF